MHQGGGGKIPILPDDYLVHLDEDGATLKNYEHKTFHYPQPRNGHSRELPMLGSQPRLAPCGDGALDEL